jgi:hypothetical protein
MVPSRIRQLVGVVLKDFPRYGPALWTDTSDYLAVRNRHEVLERAPNGRGYRCEWQWTSELHAATLIPAIGARLMTLSLRDHPVRFAEAPAQAECSPQVTFVIGHRGDHKVPHLLATLKSIAAQQNVRLECIVVEQDVNAHLEGRLPSWVRHVHTPPAGDMPFCRSWAFNVGAQHARGDLLVLHDNDLLVPADYSERCLERVRAGYEVVNLKRFGFYLTERHTREVFAGQAPIDGCAPQTILQNALGGGTIAITRTAYFGIGGMDEGFVGWGGEDNEFWDRAQALRVWPYGSLPYVHLWHPMQPGKFQGDHPTLARLRRLAAVDRSERIAILRAIPAGQLSGPAGFDRQRMQVASGADS